MRHRSFFLAAVTAAALASSLRAALPDTVPYQGRVAVDGTNFTGTGQFKFAIYEQIPGDTASLALRWTNAVGATTGSTLAEPAMAVSLPVANGLYTVGLGDSALNAMQPLPASLTPGAGKRVFLRVWFDDGTHGFQQLAPDLEIRGVPFAREAITAQNATNLDGVALANLARLDSANTFTHINGLTATGAGPTGSTPAPGAIVPLAGAGTRLEFLPGYGAFRAGGAQGTEWDAANLGLYSTALGFATIARGPQSTAVGSFTEATGNSSFAAGLQATATGLAAVALGNFTTANGSYSTATGSYTFASGACSTAMGDHTTASGYGTTALGVWTAANGTFATAQGLGTSAASYAETAVGSNNTRYDPVSSTDWAPADRLFVIGNGSSDTARHDALTVHKNAAFIVQGNGPGSSNTVADDATVPVSDPGTRMMFLPGFGAFRAGTVTGAEWDTRRIGLHSCAMGYNTTAESIGTTAIGYGTTATGPYSAASGFFTTASGEYATALGCATNASSFCETAVGSLNTAATNPSATTWVGTDRLFVIGNGATPFARSDALVVLKNGDTTFSGNVKVKSLVQTSDRNRKTDIVPADTAAILSGVAALPVSTWKFKDETTPHLGPMAQDFAAAFHLGADETGIASVDADGVALASIQELKKQLDAKDARIAALEARLAALEAKLP